MSWWWQSLSAWQNIGVKLDALNETLKEIKDIMPTRQQLDDVIASLTTGLAALGTAIDNLPKPGDEDFTPEIQAVTEANANVQADINKLQPPPPPVQNP